MAPRATTAEPMTIRAFSTCCWSEMVVQHPAYDGNVVCCCMHQVRECSYKPIQMQFCTDDLNAEDAAIVEEIGAWRHTAFPVQKCANFAELIANDGDKYTWIFETFGEKSGSLTPPNLAQEHHRSCLLGGGGGALLPSAFADVRSILMLLVHSKARMINPLSTIFLRKLAGPKWLRLRGEFDWRHCPSIDALLFGFPMAYSCSRTLYLFFPRPFVLVSNFMFPSSSTTWCDSYNKFNKKSAT